MKNLVSTLLLFVSTLTNAEIISEKELLEAESGIYWHIKKDFNVKQDLNVILLFEFSSRGFGSLKLSHGKWLHVYDCTENGGFIFEPCLMKQEIKDINGDGYKDIYLTAQLIVPGEKESDPIEFSGPAFVELIYNPRKGEFELGKHTSKIQTYEYYED